MIDTLKIALKAIFTNKVRSFLTILGVIIGVGSVVLLTAIGNGLSAYVTQQFNELGANNLIVFPADIFGEGGGFSSERSASSVANSKLRLSHVREIERLRQYVKLTAPFNFQTDKITFQTQTKEITVLGSTANFSEAFNTPTAKGQFFSDSDERTGERVVVLGFEVASKLFGQIDPVGKKVKIASQTFTELGTTENTGGGFGGPPNDT